MKRDVYEVLSKRFEIEVQENQLDAFKKACDKLNNQFSSLARFDLHKTDVTALLNVVIESIQQEIEIEKINNQLKELLESEDSIQ